MKRCCLAFLSICMIIGSPLKHVLAQLSILWQCGICSQKYFANVQLWRRAETMRKMIRSANPGQPWQYGCVIAASG